jgi:3-oxoacyl-[acyl-carrier-protein] synthase II
MKVYVTGMGIISSLGNTVEDVFNALIENRTGVKAFPQWKDQNGLFSHVGAPAVPYDIKSVPRTARRTMSPMSEMAVLAAGQALTQAELEIGNGISTPRILLCIGSTTGSPVNMESYFKKLFERGGPEGQMGTGFFKIMNHSVAANVASAFGFHGPSVSPSSACATSAQAVIMGWEFIQSGLFDIVIAGGADELHYTSAAVFDTVLAASRTYNDRPEETPRPFDLKRDGLVVSEGASVVILESEESVKKRQKKPIAELNGGAYLCDGNHMSQSSQGNMVDVMKGALERAKLPSSSIQYVNAHATATIQGDQEEGQAIEKLFGDQVPVSSLKGHFGHSLAACGTIELISCIQMIKKSLLIPTRNLVDIDPQCGKIHHLKEKKNLSISTAMSNNFAFGGINTSLIVSCTEGLT